jgi:thiamine-phosphate pyrophosphorylase
MSVSALLRGPEALQRLSRARLCLLFTPELLPAADPLAALESALPHIDLLQVRPKAPGSRAGAQARATHDWALRVIDLLAVHPDCPLVLTVNDRVDVAMALREKGIAGVHLGEDDTPPAMARELLGQDALIGLSTHDLDAVIEANEQPVNYLGFGPIHATQTKGYLQGLGSELAWIAHGASSLPLFPIGGIDASNAGELNRIGRAAVSSSVLCASDPGAAARELRRLLAERE